MRESVLNGAFHFSSRVFNFPTSPNIVPFSFSLITSRSILSLSLSFFPSQKSYSSQPLLTHPTTSRSLAPHTQPTKHFAKSHSPSPKHRSHPIQKISHPRLHSSTARLSPALHAEHRHSPAAHQHPNAAILQRNAFPAYTTGCFPLFRGSPLSSQ